MPDTPSISRVTPALLARCGVRTPDAWAIPLAAACAQFAITTPPRIAGFLGNTLHESMTLNRVVESLDYAADRLQAVWPNRFPPADAQRLGRNATHPADQVHIAERAYGGRMGNRAEGSGDGWAYRGRGLIQLTGRDAYQAEATATTRALATIPAWLESLPGAAQSATRFWSRVGCNELMDRGDIHGARVRVNGGTNGMAEVVGLYGTVLGLLGMPVGKPIPISSPAQSEADATEALNRASLVAARG